MPTIDQLGLDRVKRERLKLQERTDIGAGSLFQDDLVATEAQQKKEVRAAVPLTEKIADLGSIASTSFFEAGKSLVDFTAISASAAYQGVLQTKADGGSLLDITESAILESFRQSERFDDPSYNYRDNPHISASVDNELAKRGIRHDSSTGINLLSSRSAYEFELGLAAHDQNLENVALIQESGMSGFAVAMGASLFDADILIGGGFLTKYRAAAKFTKLSAMIKSGTVTAKEAKMLRGVVSRIDNIQGGTLSGAVASGLVSGAYALDNPDMETKDVMAAMLLGASLGGTIGAVIPTNSVRKVTEDIAGLRVSEDLYKLHNASPEVKANNAFRDIMRFTEHHEGKRATGSKLIIDPALFPKAATELSSIIKESGVRAGRLFTRKFYQDTVFNKITTSDMSIEQKAVLMDTAVNHGTDAATKLFKSADGDVSKMLDIQDDLFTRAEVDQPTLDRAADLRNFVLPPPGIQQGGSVGSGYTPFIPDSTEASTRWQDKANDYWDNNPDMEFAHAQKNLFVEATAGPAQRVVQRIAQEADKSLRTIGLRTEFDELIDNAGDVGKYIATILLESPVGQIVNNRSAASVQDMISKRAGVLTSNRADYYKVWAKDKNLPTVRNVTTGHLDFGKEIADYRVTQQRGTPDSNVHDSVKAMSDDMDKVQQYLLTQLKRYNVDGFEDIEWKAGHMPTSWVGESATRIIRDHGRHNVTQGIKFAIMKASPHLDENNAFIWASAVYRHLKDRTQGNIFGSAGTVSDEGKAALEGAIRDNNSHVPLGITPGEMVDKMIFSGSSKGTAKSSRGKISMDYGTPIPGSKTGATILDLTDTDVLGNLDRMIRTQANIAAAASQGVQIRDWEDIVQAGVDEVLASGVGDPAKAAKALNHVRTLFGEGAYGGGTSAAVGRFNKLAILSLLPQLGVTSLSETGVAMGVAGLSSYMRFAGTNKDTILKGMSNDLQDALLHVNGFRGEHLEYTRTSHLDVVNLNGSTDLTKTLDLVTDQALRGLGHVSGFHRVHMSTQNVASQTMVNYLIKAVKEGKESRRLDTMGADVEFRDFVARRTADGTIEFGDTGHLTGFNKGSWSPEEVDILTLVTLRNMRQTVMQPRPGENFAWQYNDLGSLFASLRTFAFAATNKQLIRNLRIADNATGALMITSMLTAGVATMISHTLTGDFEKLTLEDIAAGALRWHGLLSPAFMAMDTMTYLTGTDQIGMPFMTNSYHSQNGLIGLPPGISVFNDLVGIGRTPLDLLDGELDYDTELAWRALPIAGRHYFTEMLTNSMKSMEDN